MGLQARKRSLPRKRKQDPKRKWLQRRRLSRRKRIPQRRRIHPRRKRLQRKSQHRRRKSPRRRRSVPKRSLLRRRRKEESKWQRDNIDFHTFIACYISF